MTLLHNFLPNCYYSNRLLDKLYPMNLDIKRIKKAIIYAKYYHNDQKRESGEMYYIHPLEVAYIVSDYLPRTDIIITAILHDTLEDTKLTKEGIIREFGQEIAEQVYDLTRVKEGGLKISSAQMLENLWKEGKRDLLAVKICDRLHNMSTISAKTNEKIRKNTIETLKSFILLSEALEMHSISDAIADYCYKANIKLNLIDTFPKIFDQPFSLGSAFEAFEAFEIDETIQESQPYWNKDQK